ncbi:MAG: polyphosphate kinase 2 [Burkholderiales bacterium]|nr:MAG: polyphosphate kinase 2 [Burkholderiales bacterium]
MTARKRGSRSRAGRKPAEAESGPLADAGTAAIAADRSPSGVDPVQPSPKAARAGGASRAAHAARNAHATSREARELAAAEILSITHGPTARKVALAPHGSAENSTRAPLPQSYPYGSRMRRAEYDRLKLELQIELLKVQKWVRDTGQRFVLLFEGRDAAGKGGTIKRFTEHLNPRGARVVALDKPTAAERGQWYFQRYVEYLPTAGEIVFFDRSWYNRAGVERVMGFCTPTEYLEFLRQCPEFERMLINSGVRLVKYWFSVSREEQLRRFISRRDDPLKHWKLSPIDLRSLDLWDAYTEAKNTMFFHTDTGDAPWTVIKSDDKKRARLNCLRHFLHRLDYPDKDVSVAGAPDPLLVGPAGQVLEQAEREFHAFMRPARGGA